jgi:hypothetical protein
VPRGVVAAAFVGCVVASSLVTVATAAPVDPQAVRAARDAVYDRTSFQRELPGRGEAAVAPTVPPTPEPPPRDEASPGSSVGTLVLWILIAVVGVVLVVWLVTEIGLKRRPLPVSTAPGAAPVDAIAPALPDALLADAEAQAGAGRFAEAIHGLLLATLAELARRARTSVRASWTSREVLARTGLPPIAHSALGELVSAVELSHFGAAAVGPDDFARCRDRYQAFARTYARSAEPA